MNKTKKIDCYCFLYSQPEMCAAHTLKKWRDEILNDKSLRRKLFGLSQAEKAQIKRLERHIYQAQPTEPEKGGKM